MSALAAEARVRGLGLEFVVVAATAGNEEGFEGFFLLGLGWVCGGGECREKEEEEGSVNFHGGQGEEDTGREGVGYRPIFTKNPGVLDESW